MNSKAQRQQAREAAIKASYQKMVEEKNHHRERIFQLLAEKHFLSITTIEKIVWGENERRRQLREAKRVAQTTPAPS